jgi:hypothetical protein
MAEDDDVIDPDEDLIEEELDTDDLEAPDLDEEDLEDDVVDEDLDDEVVPDVDEDEDEDVTPAVTRRRLRAGEDEDEDEDDIISPDDVEADLDRILKDRMVASDEDAEEEEEDDVIEERADPGDRLQPKRPDETLCSSCFLLVRSTAPGCPVADDDCPIFS